MSRPECSREENILRAVCEAHWDGKRFDSDLFANKGISVSRLAVASFQEICSIFRNTIKAPVVTTAEINVGHLQDIGNSNIPPKILTVEEDPLENNRAHAEIPQRISPGLAKRIISVLKLRDMVD